MTPDQIVEKLTEAIRISERASIWNEANTEENPQPLKALNMIDDLIVDVLIALDPNWKRPD